MDHPCHKCGHSIEDGKAFCSNCGAPQIRVAMAEAPATPIVGKVSGAERPVFALDPPVTSGRSPTAGFSTSTEWPRALRVCAAVALVAVVTMSLRLMTPLLAVFAAGFLVVILYRYRNPFWNAGARSGAQLGALTALFTSGVVAILSAIAVAVLQAGGPIRQQALDALQEYIARSHDPQMQANLDWFKNADGLAAKVIVGLIGFLLVSVAASSIAGALAGVFLGRRNRP